MSTVYSLNYSISDHAMKGFVAGSLTTDGTIGVLAPQNIVDWQVSVTLQQVCCFGTGPLLDGGQFSASDGFLAYTAGLQATDTNLSFGGISATLKFSGGPGEQFSFSPYGSTSSYLAQIDGLQSYIGFAGFTEFPIIKIGDFVLHAPLSDMATGPLWFAVALLAVFFLPGKWRRV